CFPYADWKQNALKQADTFPAGRNLRNTVGSMPSEASRPVRTVLESKSATPMHDTRTMMIKPTALLLPALFFFPHAYAPAADLSENK
ncbi:hypothetical protein, partial [Escherichia coli]|uniref:hypothetical protein n=1 Tax=Escherichia coli TaxID=562 RepID=UPI00374814B2